jgi:hypothetical protein
VAGLQLSVSRHVADTVTLYMVLGAVGSTMDVDVVFSWIMPVLLLLNVPKVAPAAPHVVCTFHRELLAR